MFSDVYGMKADSQFVNTLEDCICERGAMSQLVSDCAQVEISKRVLELIKALCISNWNSEPNQQHIPWRDGTRLLSSILFSTLCIVTVPTLNNN